MKGSIDGCGVVRCGAVCGTAAVARLVDGRVEDLRFVVREKFKY